MAKKYEIIVERDASRVTLDIQQVVPALPAIAGAPAAAERAELAAGDASQALSQAVAWAEGVLPPDPMDPSRKSSKSWADDARATAERIDLGALDAAVTQTGADVLAAAGQVDLAAAQVDLAAAQKAAAQVAKVQAESARDEAEGYATGAAVLGGWFNTIALGRAGVADDETFGVRAGGTDGLTRPTIYRRDSIATQTLIVELPRGTEVDALSGDVTGLQDQIGSIRFDATSEASAEAWVITDEDGNASVIGLDAEGHLSERSANELSQDLRPRLVGGLTFETIVDTAGVSIAVTDEDGRKSDIDLDAEGHFSERVVDLLAVRIGARLPVTDLWSGPPPRLVTIGDSLTAGAGASATATRWRSLLSARLGIPHEPMGVGGENARTIVGRTGALPFRVTVVGGTIPAAATAVEVSLTGFDGGAVAPLMQGTAAGEGLNPCVLAGVEGTLSRNSSTGLYYFTRATAGTAVALAFPEHLTPAAFGQYRGCLPIIGIGQNGGFADEDDLIRMYWAMLRWNSQARADRYLVWSAPSGTTASRAALEARFNREFGPHYVNIRERLSSLWALEINGITPTSQDLSDIAVGTIPQSLRSDTVHHNDAGQNAIATCFYEAGRQLSYWS